MPDVLEHLRHHDGLERRIRKRQPERVRGERRGECQFLDAWQIEVDTHERPIGKGFAKQAMHVAAARADEPDIEDTTGWRQLSDDPLGPHAEAPPLRYSSAQICRTSNDHSFNGIRLNRLSVRIA